MWKPRAVDHALSLLLFCSLFALASAQGSKTNAWKTLTGSPPVVIARGGFSGVFPDSSYAAYSLVGQTSGNNYIAWCDVQLTKDSFGICIPDIKLDNATNIAQAFQNKSQTYLVNGAPVRGYFSVDYNLKDLASVFLVQGVYSRTNDFDGNLFSILTVDELVKETKPPALWLNIQHDAFYTQHNLSMRNFVLTVSKRVIVSYISSPEAGFLRGIVSRFNAKTTKLVFRFMDKDVVDPSTNQTYGSYLKNLTFIKTFASGILVPKDYIWPVDGNLYLQPHTSLVADAHKAGLEVFASNFVNDVPSAFNYSYDPLAEYLQFIDNGDFSVDGVLSDFPITPAEAVGCFALLGANAKKTINTTVISKCGASGDYPGCTNKAYEKAISDGADVIDCPVQMSKDGTPFCLSSADLIESTTVAQTRFARLAKSIPEIKSGSGIFTFSLTWEDIQTLTPSISSPYSKFKLFRNPKYDKSNINFLSLSDFLDLARNKTSLSSVVIIIENAAYLAEKEDLSVTDAVMNTLSKAGYDKTGAPRVMIQSTNSSVLMKFKGKTNYERVYEIDELVGDAVVSAVNDIKSFANSVVLQKKSVYPTNSDLFLTVSTNIVTTLHHANLSVYAQTFSNEFVSQAWDFFSDPTVEINTFVQEGLVDGVITDFPKTADRYRRNKCLTMGDNMPVYMLPVQIGGLLQAVTKDYLPPASAPLPPLKESEVKEPPLPSASPSPTPSGSSAGNNSAAQSPKNAQVKVTISFLLSPLAVLVACLLL
ncbi:hypothetical protein HN51_061574 [Arachis hypogaea]|uniref:glycerophosphodiester phosphodiesterase n=1 Tax=Arachis hypogaea TaxID=3818 RepID=A0A445ANU9_ARAHY|nr:glycerophosphodiester phosphodiesterase GDPDL4 [Arachis ipaensis]XP_025626837.1 glycerophosphodiester phosphodiesterase GDPDL4 [Arachis hypogaea]QHO18867.1 Glycerophosphodiester phosphodiesterase [Arachis hypogaea]RYR28099.1 hypothetical protein Ahy_B01g052208 [Arachis hypogaea]